MKKIIIVIFSFALLFKGYSQQKNKNNTIKIDPIICYASGKIERAAIPPPAEFLNKSAEKKSEIIVDYNFFPPEAENAFEHAVEIWESIIESPIPIYVSATWKKMDDDVLGSCAPETFVRDFKNAPRKNTYYPISLAEKLSKEEITDSDTPDITASFNSNFDWYFGTDLNPPDTLYDFVTVVIHEIGHGLGFFGFFTENQDKGIYGNEEEGEATPFDYMVVNNSGAQLINSPSFPNNSVALLEQLTSNSIYSNSPVAIFDNNGNRPRLFAPSTWDDGSSIYHLNEFTYPSTNINSLMTPQIGEAEAVHNPGPITMGIMADIGWKNLFIDFTPPKDIETKPLFVEVNLESEFDLDSTNLYFIYSTDSFQTNIDSVLLVAQPEPTLFTAEVIPNIDTGNISYYINAADIKNRIFTLPVDVPESYFSIHIGPDNIKPTIEHLPIATFFTMQDSLSISATVDDNLGVDTVFVEYKINGIDQTPFGLAHDTASVFSANFNFSSVELNNGDSISYQITAIDKSSSQNALTVPEQDSYNFKVEKVLEPTAKYLNGLDFPSTDFIISDFEIYTAQNFVNGALHSPHPYPSTEDDNEVFNFYTILKHPIIINENGSMSFDEIVLVEPGEFLSKFGDDDFWDYVIVEGTKDSGKTWLPLIDGYDSRANPNWFSAYNSIIISSTKESRAKGNPDLYVPREINLTENGNFSVGDTILIRFRLYSDPFAFGWGWAIDNLRIQVPLSSSLTTIAPENIIFYPNPFTKEIYLTIDIRNNAEKVQCDIYNIYGQIVKSLIFNDVVGKVTEVIPLEELKKGLYLATVRENGEIIYTKKIVKN